jgi:hypothetical protein
MLFCHMFHCNMVFDVVSVSSVCRAGSEADDRCPRKLLLACVVNVMQSHNTSGGAGRRMYSSYSFTTLALDGMSG